MVSVQHSLDVRPATKGAEVRTRVNFDVCALTVAGKVWSGGSESITCGKYVTRKL
jgi:hypothetical protein